MTEPLADAIDAAIGVLALSGKLECSAVALRDAVGPILAKHGTGCLSRARLLTACEEKHWRDGIRYANLVDVVNLVYNMSGGRIPW